MSEYFPDDAYTYAFVEEFKKIARAGLIGAGIGAGLGGFAGYGATVDPRGGTDSRLLGVLAGATAGALGGYGAVRGGAHLLRGADNVVAPVQQVLKEAPVVPASVALPPEGVSGLSSELFALKTPTNIAGTPVETGLTPEALKAYGANPATAATNLSDGRGPVPADAVHAFGNYAEGGAPVPPYLRNLQTPDHIIQKRYPAQRGAPGVGESAPLERDFIPKSIVQDRANTQKDLADISAAIKRKDIPVPAGIVGKTPVSGSTTDAAVSKRSTSVPKETREAVAEEVGDTASEALGQSPDRIPEGRVSSQERVQMAQKNLQTRNQQESMYREKVKIQDLEDSTEHKKNVAQLRGTLEEYGRDSAEFKNMRNKLREDYQDGYRSLLEKGEEWADEIYDIGEMQGRDRGTINQHIIARNKAVAEIKKMRADGANEGVITAAKDRLLAGAGAFTRDNRGTRIKKAALAIKAPSAKVAPLPGAMGTGDIKPLKIKKSTTLKMPKGTKGMGMSPVSPSKGMGKMSSMNVQAYLRSL